MEKFSRVLPVIYFPCGAGEPKIRADSGKFFQPFRYAEKPERRTAMPTEQGATKAPNKNYVDTKIIATLFGLTARRIQQLTQDGILKTEQVGKQRRYDLLDTVRRYIAYLQDKCNSKGGSKDDSENESRKIKADADLKATKAEIVAMELQELKGEMHRSEDVEAMTTDLVFNIRSMMLALPGRLAIDLATIDKPAEISERIKQEVHAILLELSNYTYDSDAYKKRVRDRQGWGELTKDTDDE